MALLDTIQLLLSIITGYHVPPALTVILIQLTIPLTCLFTQFVHSDGCCRGFICHGSSPEDDNHEEVDHPSHPHSEIQNNNTGIITNNTAVESGVGRPIPGFGGLSWEHVLGSVVLSLAVLLGLVPATIALFEPGLFQQADQVPLRTAYNTFLYTFSCVPAAASQLYKEHIFLQHKQPVDANSLNLLISIFQFIFIIIISPLVYSLQGFGFPGNWIEIYPSQDISNNFSDGFQCFLGTLDDDIAESRYPASAQCDYSLLIVIVHVFSILVVGVAVDKIVHAGATKIMFRGISAGIILAVLTMFVYDQHDPDFNYGPVVDSLHFVCTLILILGAEVYHRVSLQDATFETVYLEVENIYDDD